MSVKMNDDLEVALKEFFRENIDYAFIKNKDMVYIAASDAFAKMACNRRAEEITGLTDYDIFSKELADKYTSDDRKVLEGQIIEGITEKLPEKDGQERWTKTWKKAIYDKNGDVIGLYGIGRDITDNVRLETEIKTADEYIDLINNIPGGVGIIHEEEGIPYLDYVNDGWFGAHHVSHEYGKHFIGNGIAEVIHEQDRAEFTAEYERIKDDDSAEGRVAYRVIGEDRNFYWVDMHFHYAYTKNDVRYYYAIYNDLDEQKKIEVKLEESRSALREAIANSDIQFFTYFPDEKRCELYEVNNRLSELPTSWNDFPQSFLKYMKASEHDAGAYREMIHKIDAGGDEAECTVQFSYKGRYIWERVRLRAIRDSSGRCVRAQGYSINIDERKKAQERLQKERVRLKSLEGNVFEAFSFNLSTNHKLNIMTQDDKMLEGDVPSEMLDEAVRISPALKNTNPETREILLRAAGRIPEEKDRELFINTCCGAAVREAVREGRYSAEIKYRRYFGDYLRWVSSSAEVMPDPDSGDLIAFYYTRDINDEMVRDKLADRIISSNYEEVAYCDLQEGKIYIKSDDHSDDNRYDGMPYSEFIDGMISENVCGEEADELKEKYSLDMVRAELENTPIYTLYYTKNADTGGSADGPHRRMKNDIFYLDYHKDVIIMLSSDVTSIFEQERENREKMAQALAAAEQASVAKTEFLSRMSHEIRTPMNAIIGLDAIALHEKDISPAMEDHLQKIGISARFLLSLINDILDMSRIESGRMMLKNELFDFEELINSINTILYEQCRDNGLDYECVLKSFTEDVYVGDVTKLQQVLVNILGNAVKFTPEGGKVYFMIEQLSRTKGKAKLRFEISDTGMGIDPKYLPHIFEPFSQEERSKTSTYGGSGLGLAISKNIINLMGGEIDVHSIKDVGSSFIIDVELGLSKESIRRRKLLDSQLGKLFTLIVDDDVIVCRHTQMILNEAGLKTEWIDSGAGAVEKVVKQHKIHYDYDLILLDWKMPDMDGIETAKEIRKIVGPEVTIIIMTSYDWSDIEKKAKAAGVDMFMKKPVFASSVTRAFENVFVNKKNTIEIEPEINYDFTGRRILLAEDNVINAEIARNILEMKECEIDIAENGAEAVEMFAASDPGYYDAILMDIRMPIMDGLEATKAIRAMRKEESKSIPIIAMTADAFQEDVNISLESGMNAHLSKPIEPTVLYKTLRKYFD